MRILGITLLSCATVAMSAQTPITLSNSNMPASGDTLRYTSVSINSIGNYTQTGTNFAWDFSAVTSGTSGVRAYKPALATPYAIFFASFTGFAEKLPDLTVGGATGFGFTDYYNFYKKQSNPQAFIADGVGLTFSMVPLPSYYTDKDEIYNFPMTYPKYDSTTYKFTTPSMSLIPIVYTSKGYRVTRVDGWGTVKTPYGTDNCLRLVSTVHGMDSIKNTIFPIPLGFPNITRTYQWLTSTSKIPYFEVSGNVIGNNFIPSQARYRGYDKTAPPPPPGDVGVQGHSADAFFFYPNPVNERLYLGTIREASIKITDLGGRMVLDLPKQDFSAESGIDVHELARGLYVLTISKGDEHFAMKFSKD